MNKILNISPYKIAVNSDVALVEQNLRKLYPTEIWSEATVDVADYHVDQSYTSQIRKLIKPQTVFKFDQVEPFLAQQANQSYANLEWGLNYVIASNSFEYVILHSGVVAYKNKAVVFPAPPGSGKSTLTAYLQGQTNWRLLSDEMALIKPETNLVVPFVRPICLKNRSIDVVKSFYPDGNFSSIAPNTHKGDVIHLSPSEYSWQARNEVAEITAIIFPRFVENSELEIISYNQTQGFMELAENAFNFNILAKKGFDTLTHIIEKCQIFELRYSDVSEVKSFLESEVLA